MSESKVYPVKAHIGNGALLDKEVMKPCIRRRCRIRTPSGGAGQDPRLDDPLHPRQEHLLRSGPRLHQVVRGWSAQRLGQLPGSPSEPSAATRSPSSGRGT